MARHSRTPAPRHRAQGRNQRPASSEASERRFGAAVRRVVVTPTFAAGLGVVVAAMLAYPMRTVFSYVSPGALGPGGIQCGQLGCSRSPLPSGKPVPEGGGVRNPPPASSQAGKAGTGTEAAAGQPQF